jgi:hypothetical protein
VREHWRDPGYWRWLWRKHVRLDGSTKAALAVLLGIAVAIGGYLSAFRLAPEEEPQVLTSERLVTQVRKVPGGMTTEVVTQRDLITREGKTVTDLALQTVVRDGETVVIGRPGRTVTETIDGKVVVRQVTDTVTRTSTVERPTTTTVRETETRPSETVTGPTTTETRDVPGPERTVTETETETETTALIVHTVTETETETETETVTVTEPPKPPKP